MSRRATLRGALPAVLVAGLALVPAVARAQSTTGRWEIDTDRADGRVHLQLRVGRGDDSWMSGFTIGVEDLSGLDAATVAGDARGVTFRLEREAGTISMTGDFRGGRGDGTFSFVPSDPYRETLARLGYPGISGRRLLLFATLDVTTDYVRQIQQLGYESLDEEDLVRFVIHGVSPGYIREMNDLGYDSIAPEQLVRLRIHGVSPEYVRRIRAALHS